MRPLVPEDREPRQPLPALPPLPSLPPLPPTPPAPNKFDDIKKVKRVKLRKRDMLVLRTDLFLDRDQVQAMRDRASEQFAGHKVAILTAGLDLVILRRPRR